MAALPRFDPGYTQWLERQSLLGSVPALTAQVSGSGRLWQNNSSSRRLSVLLEAAPNWLMIAPAEGNHNGHVLHRLASSETIRSLAESGCQGLYLTQRDERGDIWLDGSKASSFGQNGITALKIDERIGTEKDLAALTDQLDAASMQLGGEILPAATGLGPDFMLQTRGDSRFQGLYAMVAVPQDLWSLLPPSQSEWDCRPLPADAVTALAAKGLLPNRLSRQTLPWASEGGWAATGEILGTDGQRHRKAYYYSRSPIRPVLLWQDPSGQAKRIFSAAVIRHIGLQRQTLAGLRFEPLIALDAAPESFAEKTGPEHDRMRLEPGLTALGETCLEVHRYGGWTMQADIVSPSFVPALLSVTDFCRDSITPAASAYAALTGDAGPLARMLEFSITNRIPHYRLAHGLHDPEGIDLHPLLTLPDGKTLLQRARAASGLGTEAFVLPETAISSKTALLASITIGLPGLCFIRAQDFPDTRAPSAQPHSDGLLPVPVTALLKARARQGLAQGRIRRIVHSPSSGAVGVLTALPSGGYWFLAVNFSEKRCELSLPLPKDSSSDGIKDIATGKGISPSSTKNDGQVTFILGPLESRHVLFLPTQRKG
ncbi:MAG: hypothetical protein J5838_05910 [Desulfovibrio sp.]|nr:hypothetical protein [Desulfovibrio sp.]